MTRVAIVLGTFNRLSHLERAIASIRRAVGSVPYEIIVVDGGSSDGSREWLAKQDDVVLIGQRGALTGAVAAFNLGFGCAVDAGFDYVCHFNDDAEFVEGGHVAQIAGAITVLKVEQGIGEVAFAFDLRGSFDFDRVHGKPYANFGVVRREAGMAVARAQGDASGRRWWNPLYRTYGADSEFGAWLWKLGWRIDAIPTLRVHDHNVRDALRASNEHHLVREPEGQLFWARWSTPAHLKPQRGLDGVSWHGAKLHLGCGDKHLPGWLNVDGLQGPAVDVVFDLLDDLRRVPAGHLAHVYWSHGPEHIAPDLLPGVFRELRRVLQPGAPLTLATIDLVGIWRNRFEAQNNGNAWNAALYGESCSYHHPFLAHRQCFTHESLSEALHAAEFRDIRRWQPEDYPEICALNDYATSCRLVTAHIEGRA